MRPPANVILASLLERFAENYGECWYYKESDGGFCDHGHIVGASFDTADLADGRLALPADGGKFWVVARGERYFPYTGAIFSYEAFNSDQFCALLEDGRYFVCDDFGRCILGTERDSYRQKLKHLGEVLLESKLYGGDGTATSE